MARIKFSMNYSGDMQIYALTNGNYEIRFMYPPYNEDEAKTMELTKDELINLRKGVNHFVDFRMD